MDHGIPATTESLLDQLAVRVRRHWWPVLGCQSEVKSAGQSRWSPDGRFCRRSPSPASRWSYRDPGSPTKLSNHDIGVLQFLPREHTSILAAHSERPAEVRFSPSLQAKGFFASALR